MEGRDETSPAVSAEPRAVGPRRRREVALREENVGGRRVPDANEAAVRIQSGWRSKLVRKAMRRQAFFATELQRRVRGKLQRIRYAKDRERLQRIRREESVRLDRLRRIRTRERELAMLRAVPADQYISVDKIRRETSARVVQRLWRRSHPRRRVEEVSAEEGDPFQRRVDELHENVLRSLPPPEELERILKESRESNGGLN